jgi:general transcription factor 3C polypeptide 3 (transcription factor C subunit 4)
LNPEIQDLLGAGNAAYAMEQMEDAISIMHEIIRIDASVYEAWVTLAHINNELGNTTKALGLDIVAAHLKQDPDTWKILAGKSR